MLNRDGVTFKGDRAPGEGKSEFLSSKDNWFRPVQARTGPDGALYIVDMYRFVVEHPRWIPPERLAKLDVRAGENQGRIYRLVPVGGKLRSIRNLTTLATAGLVSALNSPNGTERDRVHLELLRRKDPAAAAPLIELFQESKQPELRLQALSVLDGLQAVTAELLEKALNDNHRDVRRHAIRLSEHFFCGETEVRASLQPAAPRAVNSGPASASAGSRLDGVSPHSPGLPAAVLQLTNDPELTVRYQLALSLGAWDDARAGETLGQLARTGLEDPWMRAAVASSATRFPVEILKIILGASPESSGRTELTEQLIATAVLSETKAALYELLAIVAPPDPGVLEPWRLWALSSLIDGLHRRGTSLQSLAALAPPLTIEAVERIEKSFAAAYSVAKSATADDALREAAIQFIGRSSRPEDALPWLNNWLFPGTSLQLQTAAVAAIARTASPDAPDSLLKNWSAHTPAVRNRIVSTLLTREDWVKTLLGALEKETVPASELSLSNRQRLLQDGNENVRKRAEALFGAAPNDSRAQVRARYQTVEALAGNLQRGAAVFEKNCSTCHAFGGQGHAVGPDLAAFRTKSLEDFMVAILDPNAAIEPRFLNYQIEVNDGRLLSGVVKAEAANSLIIIQGGGLEESVLRRDIVAMKASSLSLMPEGLEQNISPQEMADLIAWLKQSGAPPTL